MLQDAAPRDIGPLDVKEARSHRGAMEDIAELQAYLEALLAFRRTGAQTDAEDLIAALADEVDAVVLAEPFPREVLGPRRARAREHRYASAERAAERPRTMRHRAPPPGSHSFGGRVGQSLRDRRPRPPAFGPGPSGP